MSKREQIFGIFIAILIVLGYVLPYTVFSTVSEWYGSFFIWTLLAVLIIIANFILSNKWGEK